MSRSSSAVVDSKVVEMTLENTNFEQNATKTLSTIQKLKEALNFTKTGDGLDQFNTSLKKVDFNPLATGIDTARHSMSALDAISFGFFSKIGAQIEQTTMQYAKMFTSKPIEDGFAEYELKMGSVQTILMGARTKEGLPVTLDMVNQKLDELNAYADKTIYSFSDMTANIGKFTNAGVDLDTAVAAIQGISNEAALAGANSQQASHAMYNFAQALSAGYVKLIDWKSIENANMATVDFKQTLIDTAVELGTLEKHGDDYISITTDMNGKVSQAFNATKAFNESLSAQWMSTDVLTAALAKYSDETSEVGKKAFQAATEVKTFTQLIDTLQEAAGSGWAQTWELLIGDFDESKKLFTLLSNTFGGIIDAQAKARNALLEEGLGAPMEAVTQKYWKNLDLSTRQTKLLYQELMEVGKANGVVFKSDDYVGFINSLKEGWLSTNMLADAVKKLNGEGVDGEGMSKELDEINEAARRVIRGDFGNNMAERIQKLNEEGFDGEKIQEYVNEIYKLSGGTWNLTDAILEQAAANVGLEESMKGTSGEFDDIIDKVDGGSFKKSGRELLFDSIARSINGFKKIAASIKGAWDDVFPPATGDVIYKIARSINDVSKAFRLFALRNAEKIRAVFRGIFSVFSLVLSIGKRLIGTVFKGLGAVFNALSGPIGSFIGWISDLLSMFHDWAVQNQIVERTFGAIEGAVGAVTDKIVGWFDAFKALPVVQNVLDKFSGAFDYVRDNFPQILDGAGKSLSTFKDNIVAAFTNVKSPKEFFEGIKTAFQGLWKDISASTLITNFKAGFANIRTVINDFFLNIGRNADGSLNTFGKLWVGFIRQIDAIRYKLDAIKKGIHNFFEEHKIGEKLAGIFKSIGAGITGFFGKLPGFVATAKAKFGEFIDEVKNLGGFKIENLGKIWEALKQTIGNIFKDSDLFEPLATAFRNVRSKVVDLLKDFGIDILAIKDKIVGFFVGIKNGIGNVKLPDIFSKIIDFFTKEKKPVSDGATTFGDVLIDLFGKIKNFIMGLDVRKITGIIAALLALKGLKTLGTFVKPLNQLLSSMAAEKKAKANFLNKAALLEMAGAFALLAVAIAILAKIKATDIIKGVVTIGAVMIMFTVFAKSMNKLNPKNMIAASAMMASAAGSLILAIAAIMLIGTMLLNHLPTALAGLAGAVVLVLALGAMMKVMQKVSGGTRGLATAKSMMTVILSLYALLGLIMLISFMPLTQILKGIGKLVPIILVLAVTMALMKKAVGEDGLKISIGIAGLAACILAIGAALWIISKIDPERLVGSVGALGLVMAALVGVVYAAKGIENGLSTMLGLALVIGVIAASLAVLALIEPTKLIAPVAAITILIGMLALLSVAVGKMKPALSAMIMMVALVAVIGTVLFLLATLPNPDTAAKIALALGVVFAGLGVAMYGAVAAGTAAGPALVGLLVMIAFIAAFTALAYAIGALVGESGAETIQKGLDIIKMVLGGLGEAVGAFFAGIATELFDALPQIGQDITDFMSNLSGLNEIGTVDIAPLLEALTAILGVSFVGFADSLLSIVSEMEEGKSSAQMMADDMAALALAFSTYQTTMDSVDDINIDTQPLMDAINAVLAASLTGFVDGLASIVTELTTGKTSVELVASDMSALATGFTDYATAMSEFDGIEIDTTALDDIIDIIGEISLQGLLSSLASLILGEEDKTQVQKFAEDMGTLSSALVDWQTQMAPLEGLTVPTDDITKLKEALDTIKEGGILDSVLGFFGVDTSPDYTSFNEGIKGLGGAINEFSNSLGEDFDEAKMTVATDAIKKLAEVGVALGDVDFGGWFHDGVLTTFANELNEIAPTLNEFAGKFEDTDKFAAIALATKQLASGASMLANVKFGNGDLTDSEIVEKVKSNVDTVAGMIESLADIDTSGVSKFTSAINDINGAKMSEAAENIATKQLGSDTGKDMSKSIGDSIDASSIGSSLSTALSSAMRGVDTSSYTGLGTSMAAQIGLGIINGAINISSSLSAAITSAKSSVEDYKSDFITAGWNFSSGLGQGIRLNKYAAINAAIDVAVAALNAAKQKLDEHSPSKETEKIGMFFDLGFAKGISGYSDRIYNESERVATLAMDGVRKAASAVSGILEGDGLDRPVITPVLDLSQVQDGASRMGSLLNTSPSILGSFSAITANADTIRQQNSNDDILNALEMLGANLGSSRGGDTYNVNGVTYDDGSNISDAVRTLIREARIERRA